MPINKNGTTGKEGKTMGYVKWSYETLNHFCGDYSRSLVLQRKKAIRSEMCFLPLTFME